MADYFCKTFLHALKFSEDFHAKNTRDTPFQEKQIAGETEITS